MKQTWQTWGRAALCGIAATAVMTGGITPAGAVQLEVIGRYDTGLGVGAAEITAFEPASNRLFVVNAATATVDILDLTDPTAPRLISTLNIGALFSQGERAAAPNSVAISAGLVAVAVELKEDDNTHHQGLVAFFNVAGELLDTAPAGALPDMVTFTPDGKFALVANEGEPNQSYTRDPEGSVTIIRVDMLRKGKRLPPGHVRHATFEAFNDQAEALRAAGVRIYGPGATAAQDFEPEYITVSADSKTAYVALQENNAIAVVNIAAAKVTAVHPLGYKDWTQSGFDASDRDNAINIQPWPVFGMFQPDAIASYRVGKETYLVTANEGDARDYAAFAEEARVSQITLDPVAFPDRDALRNNAALGRLTITTTLGANEAGLFEELYTLGGRSFSIWKVGQAGLTQVSDSGSEFEEITAAAFPADFNSTNSENGSFDTRSDNKGPEPEGVALGVIDGRIYAFIGLERVGGLMVYDITDPRAPLFKQYLNPRDFSGSAAAGTAGDLGPEGVEFIAAATSPTGQPLVIVANEISGTVTIFEAR